MKNILLSKEEKKMKFRLNIGPSLFFQFFTVLFLKKFFTAIFYKKKYHFKDTNLEKYHFLATNL